MESSAPPLITVDLIEKLRAMHPDYTWRTFPLSDYDQYSIGNPPELLICFSHDQIANCEDIPDAFSTFYGEVCEPSHWKISAEAAALIREHNQIAVAG